MPFSVDMRPHLQIFAHSFLNSQRAKTTSIIADGTKRPVVERERMSETPKGFYARIKGTDFLPDADRFLLHTRIDVRGSHSGRCFSYNEQNEAADGARIWALDVLERAHSLISFSGIRPTTKGLHFLNIIADVDEKAEDFRAPLLSSACHYARSVMEVFVINNFMIADGGLRFSMRALKQQPNGLSLSLRQENCPGQVPAFSPLNIAGLMKTGLAAMRIIPITDYPAFRDLGPYDKIFEIREASGI